VLESGSLPEKTAEVMLSILSAAIPARTATYCSAPITSGRRLAVWLKSSGLTRFDLDNANAEDQEAHRVGVIEPNVIHAQQVVSRLRREHHSVVIDPTAMGPIDDWNQASWISFWEAVIRRFARRVVFVNDWQYSFGCAHEFLATLQAGIPTYDEKGDLIAASDGLTMIKNAADDLGAGSSAASKLQGIAIAIENMRQPDASGFSP
jgi:hypothetical protein